MTTDPVRTATRKKLANKSCSRLDLEELSSMTIKEIYTHVNNLASLCTNWQTAHTHAQDYSCRIHARGETMLNERDAKINELEKQVRKLQKKVG